MMSATLYTRYFPVIVQLCIRQFKPYNYIEMAGIRPDLNATWLLLIMSNSRLSIEVQ